MPATSTIAALTLVLAANLTDAAVFPTDDANGNTRKATIAQMRTQLNTGPQIFTSTISVAGTATLQAVTATTVTASLGLVVSAGGMSVTVGSGLNAADFIGTDVTNGVYTRWNNGATALGLIGSNAALSSGSLSDFCVRAVNNLVFNTNSGERGRMTSGGVLAWGTAITTAASAGEMVLQNGKSLRGVRGDLSGTVSIVQLNGNNQIVLGENADRMPNFPISVAAGINASNSIFAGSFVWDSTNNWLVGYGPGGTRYKFVGVAY
jgi:hypothetical protein